MCTDHHLLQTLILFAQLTVYLSTVVDNFDNVIIMGDFNTFGTKKDCSGFLKLGELCDTFKITRLITSETSETYFTNNHKSTIDLLITKKPFIFSRILHK